MMFSPMRRAVFKGLLSLPLFRLLPAPAKKFEVEEHSLWLRVELRDKDRNVLCRLSGPATVTGLASFGKISVVPTKALQGTVRMKGVVRDSMVSVYRGADKLIEHVSNDLILDSNDLHASQMVAMTDFALDVMG